MNLKPTLWLATLADFVPPLAVVSDMAGGAVERAVLGHGAAWPPRERQRRRALQTMANALCNAVTSDRRYPNEVRLNHPEGGLLVLDILSRSCTLNNATVDAIGLVDRLSIWLRAQLDNARIPEDRVRAVRLEVQYTASERTYLASGRVWEMNFSLRSEVATAERSYIGSTQACKAAVPYGIGAMTPW